MIQSSSPIVLQPTACRVHTPHTNRLPQWQQTQTLPKIESPPYHTYTIMHQKQSNHQTNPLSSPVKVSKRYPDQHIRYLTERLQANQPTHTQLARIHSSPASNLTLQASRFQFLVSHFSSLVSSFEFRVSSFESFYLSSLSRPRASSFPFLRSLESQSILRNIKALKSIYVG